MLRRGDFEVATDAQCSSIVEPDIDLHKFQSTGVTGNYSRYKDPVLDDLYHKQSRATDPEERKRLPARVREAPLDEEVHYITTLAVAPDRAAQRQGAGLDDHAAPLPEPAARHGLARASRAERPRAAPRVEPADRDGRRGRSRRRLAAALRAVGERVPERSHPRRERGHVQRLRNALRRARDSAHRRGAVLQSRHQVLHLPASAAQFPRRAHAGRRQPGVRARTRDPRGAADRGYRGVPTRHRS